MPTISTMRITTKEDNMSQPVKQQRRPAHPGKVLAGMLEDINISQTELARRIKVSRRTVSLIINGHQPITTDIAIRLGKFCGNGPDIWLNLQRQVDLWDQTQKHKRLYESIKPINKAA